MDLNNINLEDIKEKLLSIDKKTLIKYGSVVGAVILFLIIYYAILNPIVIALLPSYSTVSNWTLFGTELAICAKYL